MTTSSFHYDPAQYHERVVRIAERVVPHETAVPTIAPHGSSEDGGLRTAATENHQDGVTRLDPSGRR